MKKITTVFLVICLLSLLNPSQAAELLPESDAAFQQRMQWFTDAQFGLFIHYGVYSTLGGEWKGEPVKKYAEWIQRWGSITPEEYIPLAANFRPDKLDADLWVKTAKEAGMKYMVITSKHHEGFCLWDSAYTEYDLGEATDFDRDILGELAVACKKHGLKFGTYYSIIDWHHPSQRDQQAMNKTPMRDKAGYVTYMKGQLKELIDCYQPAIMWFDGDWTDWWTMDDGIDLYNYLRDLDPELIINNRVAKRKIFKKDYGTPEQKTPGAALDHVWEACWTVNHSWGFKKSDTNWKSTDVLVQKLIDINTKGGNLLLNVGPKADGSWPDASIRQLKEMGQWNSAHTEAVYGTEFVDLPAQTWGKLAMAKGSTEKAGELFVYVFDWPVDGKLVMAGVNMGQAKAFTYDGQSLPVSPTEKGLEIDLGSASKHDYATVLRLKYGSFEHYPKFSWDTVPLYMHMRKSAAFTPEELDYLAGFPLITLDKTTGSATYGSSVEGSRMAAKAIKAVLPHDGYSVNNNDSSVWLTRFPEFDKPLGPPKGPAVQDGYTYTREFEHASVFLDIEKKQGRVTWKETAP
ncbi:alpha-L-fucosidase [Planctomycetota bacterium]